MGTKHGEEKEYPPCLGLLSPFSGSTSSQHLKSWTLQDAALIAKKKKLSFTSESFKPFANEFPSAFWP